MKAFTLMAGNSNIKRIKRGIAMGLKKDVTAGTYEGDTIPKATKWVYSVSGMFRDALYALVSGFLTNYIMYSGVLGHRRGCTTTLKSPSSMLSLSFS
jgi:hypothetical protein